MTDPGSVADLEHTPYESVSAVSFHTDRKGNVSGRFRGAVVLRDRSSEEIIRPGETWFCSLRLNPISLGNYFAGGGVVQRKAGDGNFVQPEECNVFSPAISHCIAMLCGSSCRGFGRCSFPR